MLNAKLNELNLQFVLEPMEGKVENYILAQNIHFLNKIFAGKVVVHNKTGNLYFIYGFEVGNRNGESTYDVKYFAVSSVLNGQPFVEREIPFNRPCSEFFDGRFVEFK